MASADGANDDMSGLAMSYLSGLLSCLMKISNAVGKHTNASTSTANRPITETTTSHQKSREMKN